KRMRLTTGVVIAGLVVSVAPAWAQARGQRASGTKPEPREVYLTLGGDVNAADASGTTALHRAAQANDAAGVPRLLRRGAKANAANRYGVTPLSLAAKSGSGAVVDALLKGGAD